MASGDAGCVTTVPAEVGEAALKAGRILMVNDILLDLIARYEKGGFFDLNRYSCEILKRLGLWDE